MKKILYCQLTVLILFLVFTTSSNAQSRNSIDDVKKSFNSKDLNNSKGIVEVKFSEVSIKAQKDFSKTFGEAKNAKWYKANDGFIASFTNRGNSMRSHYDLKGSWKYDMATYTEEKLPSDVRYLVKGTYYDFAITLVNEIKTADKTIHIVHLTDKNYWINLWVCDGAMEVLEQNVKSE